MPNNKVGYGLAQIANPGATLGRVFVVSGTSGANFQDILTTWTNDSLGVVRNFTTITDALAACTSGRGDIVLLSPDFTTAATAAELLSAESKGVLMVQSGQISQAGIFQAWRATAALPATTQSAIFTVTGRVQLVDIIGEVTTVIQTQADNLKLVSNPTVGADVDICAVKDVTAAAVGTQLSITGTFATAMVQTASGAFVRQAASTIIAAGTLDLSASATNTGSVKWTARYIPVDPGARMIAA